MKENIANYLLLLSFLFSLLTWGGRCRDLRGVKKKREEICTLCSRLERGGVYVLLTTEVWEKREGDIKNKGNWNERRWGSFWMGGGGKQKNGENMAF